MTPRFTANLQVALCLALQIGCATVGHKFDMAAVDRLQPGVSTLSDAVAPLSPYSGQTVTASGLKIYTWTYAAANGLTGSAHSQAVSLAFGGDGLWPRGRRTNVH